MSEVHEDGSFIIDNPRDIRMFSLLSMRGRLHLEMAGMNFGMSTLAAMQRQGITAKRTRKGALVDLNALIESLGGPADRRSDS